MTNFTIGRWLLVALAIVGLAFASGLVSAHGTDTTADDAPPYDAGDDWATWMEDHMGPGSVGHDDHPRGAYGYADDHPRGAYGHDDYRYDDHPRGVYGQGHCGRP